MSHNTNKAKKLQVTEILNTLMIHHAENKVLKMKKKYIYFSKIKRTFKN